MKAYRTMRAAKAANEKIHGENAHKIPMVKVGNSRRGLYLVMELEDSGGTEAHTGLTELAMRSVSTTVGTRR